MAAIETDGLTKRYGDVVGIEDVSLTVERGEVFGYLGPNGAGKTTTIRTLLGFLQPTSGEATVLGAPLDDAAALREARGRIGFLPSTMGFPEEVTGRRYLDHHERLLGGERRAELLELFDPPLDRPIEEYSTGNRRMLGIVRAFMHDPELVILDEPTSGLDPLKQAHFNAFVREEVDRDTTVFFSSHVLGEVRRVCDRIGILRGGELVTVEPIDDLLDRGGKRVRVRVDGDPSRIGAALDGVVDRSVHDDEATFTFTGEYGRLLEHLAGLDRVLDVEIAEPPLEDLFLHYYGEDVENGGGDGIGGGNSDGDGRNAGSESAGTESASSGTLGNGSAGSHRADAPPRGEDGD